MRSLIKKTEKLDQSKKTYKQICDEYNAFIKTIKKEEAKQWKEKQKSSQSENKQGKESDT